jgi:hypothetical protein
LGNLSFPISRYGLGVGGGGRAEVLGMIIWLGLLSLEVRRFLIFIVTGKSCYATGRSPGSGLADD